MKSDIIIANLKCGGCANTIQRKLSSIEGVNEVSVDQEKDTVTVEHSNSVVRESLTSLLKTLGYPEATEENGLLLQIKSYASCMVGRMSKN